MTGSPEGPGIFSMRHMNEFLHLTRSIKVSTRYKPMKMTPKVTTNISEQVLSLVHHCARAGCAITCSTKPNEIEQRGKAPLPLAFCGFWPEPLALPSSENSCFSAPKGVFVFYLNFSIIFIFKHVQWSRLIQRTKIHGWRRCTHEDNALWRVDCTVDWTLWGRPSTQTICSTCAPPRHRLHFQASSHFQTKSAKMTNGRDKTSWWVECLRLCKCRWPWTIHQPNTSFWWLASTAEDRCSPIHLFCVKNNLN